MSTSSKTDPASIINNGEYVATLVTEDGGNIKKFRIQRLDSELDVEQVLDLWESDVDFSDFYSSIFKQCGFASYVWEMPPLSSNTLDDAFECVLINTQRSETKPDLKTFSTFFDPNSENHGVVSFLNLGHDALLVVPSPLESGVNYSGLANFLFAAPLEQQRALWKVTAQQVKLRLSEKPTWISVAGGGVSWLHIRLDTQPKYYRYRDYAVV